MFQVVISICVVQSPSSVTPVCSRPSRLWTASDFPSGVHQGSSVCPAGLWALKVRGPQVTDKNLNESKLRKRTEKGRDRGRRVSVVYLVCELMFLLNFQETSMWCCMRRAASCPSCVDSRVKNMPWASTSPSPMNAATHICATELQHLLPPTGRAHYSHYSFHTQFGEQKY